MVKVPTEIAKTIGATDQRSKIDAVAKKLLKHKIILAWILKECIPGFENKDVKYIEENCFVGEIKMDSVSVDQDRPDADSSIVGADSVDKSEQEGEIRFDIVFNAAVPEDNTIIRVIINIEIQVNTSLPYSLVTRGVYYGSRLISRQKGTVFKDSNYQDIQKVYSVWICPSPTEQNENSIVQYGISIKNVFGNPKEEPAENYDKMDVIIISLNDKVTEKSNDTNNVNDKNTDKKKTNSQNTQSDGYGKIIRLLSALLSTNKNVDERKKILSSEFSIPMTKEINEEVIEMCNIGEAIELKGIAIGETKTTLRSIRSLMETLHFTLDEAMDALKIPEKEREEYANILAAESNSAE